MVGKLKVEEQRIRPPPPCSFSSSAGEGFVCNLVDEALTAREQDHWVQPNASARTDIAWWHTFLHVWNGISLLQPLSPTTLVVFDASGLCGCRAIYHNQWFQLICWTDASIAAKELVPIVIAVALWDLQGAGSRVYCMCDNASSCCSGQQRLS